MRGRLSSLESWAGENSEDECDCGGHEDSGANPDAGVGLSGSGLAGFRPLRGDEGQAKVIRRGQS